MKYARLILLGAALCLFNACEQQKFSTLEKMESAHGGGHGEAHGKGHDDKGHSKDDGHGH